MTIRKLTAAEVTFEVTIEADETDVRGSFATDEPELDRQQADEIIARLNRGEVEAWCGVIVTASWMLDGQEYTGQDSIWGNCLTDEWTAEAVAEAHGMRDEALADLNRTLEAAVTKGSRLARALRAGKRVAS